MPDECLLVKSVTNSYFNTFLFKVCLNYGRFSMSIIAELKHLASVLILKNSVLNIVYSSLNPVIKYCSFLTERGPYAVYFMI